MQVTYKGIAHNPGVNAKITRWMTNTVVWSRDGMTVWLCDSMTAQECDSMTVQYLS